jgi:uronate dehydrogenase
LVERLLVTGAAGRIGSVLREGLAGQAGVLRLMDIAALEPRAGEEVVQGDVTRLEDARRAVAGCEAVVHLAGIAEEAGFEEILDTNVRGTFNVFEAARLEGCRRVVFASSNHTIGFYPVGREIGTEVPVRPDSYYGVSKAFGEALGRLYFDRYGVEFVCLRIGAFQAEPLKPRHLWIWLSHRDTVQLVQRSLQAPDVGFLVVYGVSNNSRSWWRRDGWEKLGYAPVDDAEDHVERIGDNLVYRYQGGEFAEPDL